jgi:hypothetical protein
VGVDVAIRVEAGCTQLFGHHPIVPQVLLLGGLLRARHSVVPVLLADRIQLLEVAVGPDAQ